MVLVKERKAVNTVKTQVKPAPKIQTATMSGEVMAFCPTCKAFQTLWFTDGKLTPTRKFHQYDGVVVHECGSKEPCRLYRIF